MKGLQNLRGTAQATWLLKQYGDRGSSLQIISPTGVSESCSLMSNSAALPTVAHQAPLPMEFSSNNTWVGWHSLLHGIFLTQGCTLGLPNCRQILYHLSHHWRKGYVKCVWDLAAQGKRNPFPTSLESLGRLGQLWPESSFLEGPCLPAR